MLKKGQRFTPAARAAAAVKRRQLAEIRKERFGAAEVFVVRDGANRFSWEIRKYGAFVLARSISTFSSPALARAEGIQALRHERKVAVGEAGRSSNSEASADYAP